MSALLEQLENEKVFSVEYLGDGMFLVREECDGFYDSLLNRGELIQLGEELIDMANGASDEEA